MPLLEDLNQTVYSVSDLNAYVRALLEGNTNLMSIWVSGEISNLSRPSSGHVYFTLKDAFASLRCVIWRENARMLRGALQDGVAVEVHGSVSVYEQGGQYQLYVDGIRVAGEGLLYQEFLRLKTALEAEGLFDEDRKQPLPVFPARIGIVASRTSAGFQDILNTLRTRFPLAEVVLAHAAVQGESAPAEIESALSALNANVQMDVILLARGGGSLEDLWAFNDERVVRAVAASQVPVISGIGHETDFTLSDFAADVRAATPTGAAVLAVPDIQELMGNLAEFELRMNLAMDLRTAEYMFVMRSLTGRLNRIDHQRRVRDRMQRVDELQRRLKMTMNVLTHGRNQQLDAIEGRLNALDPTCVLQRGYALVRDRNGQAVTSVKQVQLTDKVDVRLRDGMLGVEVKEISEKNKD
jgi:exodeoxyribonuclease VII large subunit